MKLLTVDLGGTLIKLALIQGTKVVSTKFLDSDSQLGLRPKLPHIAANFKEHMFKPRWDHADALIIGGGTASSFESIVPTMNQAIQRYCGPSSLKLKILPIQLGNNSANLGSTALFEEHHLG